VSFFRNFSKPGNGPVLRSKNLLLRPPHMDDFKSWVDLRKANRKFLEPWEPSWSEDEFIRSNFRYRLHAYNKISEDDRGQALFIFALDSKKLLGAINISNVRRGVAQMATLGYWIGEEFTRQGAMNEALNVLLPFMFKEMNLHRIEAACLPTNIASIALLKKSGFEQEGYAKNYLKIAGAWQDHVLFAKASGQHEPRG
jgi:[ribosomal protein S5]-alanine N-acetyltransferase